MSAACVRIRPSRPSAFRELNRLGAYKSRSFAAHTELSHESYRAVWEARKAARSVGGCSWLDSFTTEGFQCRTHRWVIRALSAGSEHSHKPL